MSYERLAETATTIDFPLILFSSSSFHNSLTTSMFAAGDIKISKDYGDFTNTATLPATCPGGRAVVLSLTAAELTARHIHIQVVDQTATKLWEDQAIMIETYGTTSSQHAFNRNSFTVQASLTAAQTGVTIATVTNITNGVNLTSTAVLSNLGASATAQINAEADAALADASVTANAMNKIHDATTGASAVWNMTQSVFTVAGTFGDLLDATVSGISVSGTGDWTDGEKAQIRHALGVSGSTTSGSGGIINSISSLLTTNLDAAISTRSTFNPATTGVTLTANQTGVTIATVTNVANGVNLTTTAILNNLAASATAQISSAIFSLTLTSSSFAGDTFGERLTAIDNKLPSGSISGFDPAATGVTLTASQLGVTIANVTTVGTTNNLGASATSQINSEVLDVLSVDTIPELSQAAPSATPTHRQAIMALYMALRNKVTVTSSGKKFFNDAGTNVFTKSLSDDGTTYTEDEAGAGS